MTLQYSSGSEPSTPSSWPECLQTSASSRTCANGEENGFEAIAVKDATAGLGPESTQAAYVNYGLIANEVVTTEEIVSTLKETASQVA